MNFRNIRVLGLLGGATVAFAMGSTLLAQADEFAIKLKPGAAVETVQTQCAACHSLDYIKMNSPFLSAKAWDGEVTKMIKVFGAGISPEEAKAISDYLAKNYGG